MFSGLVIGCGTVRGWDPGRRLRIGVGTDFLPHLSLGGSLSCSGVCLSIVGYDALGFWVDVSPETLARTTIGDWAPGALVNLEPALLVGGKLGGHWVTGHIDGVSRALACTALADGCRAVRFSYPLACAPFVAEKGSVTLDGVSLTVNALEEGSFSVVLIPHTLKMTSLGAIVPDKAVNLEVDILARYLGRQLELRSSSGLGW